MESDFQRMTRIPVNDITSSVIGEFCYWIGVPLPPPPPPPVELDSTSCRLKNGQLYLSSETYVKLGLKRFKEDRSIDILQAAVGLK